MPLRIKILKFQIDIFLVNVFRVLTVFPFAILTSCDSPKLSDSVVMPVDESTPKERVKISETLREISERAAKFGYYNNFDSLPVLVTTEDIAITNRIGYCNWDAKHKGQYMVINRVNFEIENKRPYLHQIFSVLLHEIGHCYFSREHDPRLIKKEGYVAKAEVFDSVGGTDLIEPGFPVSIMFTSTEGLCNGKCAEASSEFGAVPEFKNYYVSELLGNQKALSVDELTKFRSFKWINVEKSH